MKLINLNIKLFIIFFTIITHAKIIIRSPVLSEMPDVLELDKTVTYEYFKPLYLEGYSKWPFGQNPDYFLKLELDHDEKHFSEIINNIGNERLFIANDDEKNAMAGLIVIHKEDKDCMEIDLLLIAKDYRKKGIGKQLVLKAINAFENIKICRVYPLRFANDATLKFYESLGFKNSGLAPDDKINNYGIKYSELHYDFYLNLK